MIEPGWKTKMNEQNQQMKGDLHVKVRELEVEIERLRQALVTLRDQVWGYDIHESRRLNNIIDEALKGIGDE